MERTTRKHRSRYPSPPHVSKEERLGRKHKRLFYSPPPSPTAAVQNIHFYCFPCDSNGLRKEACSFCESCMEFLCHTCHKLHRKTKSLRKHKVIEKEKMNQVRLRAKSLTDCSGKCPKHPEEIVTWYCRNHFQIGCHICKTDFHHDCNHECLKDFGREREDVVEMENELQKMENKADQKITKAKINLDIAETNFSKEVQKIRSYRQQIDNHLDALENAAISEVVQALEEDKAGMDNIIHVYSSAKEAVQRMRKELISVPHKSNDTLSLLKNDPEFINIKTKMSQNDVCNSIRTYRFEQEKELFHSILAQTRIGTIHVEEEVDMATDHSNDEKSETDLSSSLKDEDVPRSLGTFTLKSKSDRRSSYITGMDILSSEEIVVADSHNDCIKIVDINQKKVLSDVKLSFSPKDLTVVNKNRIAVTLPCAFLNMIQLISKFGPFKWKTDHSFKANGTCYGIASDGEKLFVSFTGPPKIEIMDLHGDVLAATTTSHDGQSLFNQPWHVAISMDKEYIYVSDRGNGSLTRISTNGDTKDITQVSRSSNWPFTPEGIAVTDTGSVLVCDKESDTSNIYAFKNDLSEHTVVFDKSDKIRHPQSICYSTYQGKVFVTCYEDKLRNKVFVFKL